MKAMSGWCLTFDAVYKTGVLLNSKRHYDKVLILFNNTPSLPKHKSTIVLLYNKCMLCVSSHFDH